MQVEIAIWKHVFKTGSLIEVCLSASLGSPVALGCHMAGKKEQYSNISIMCMCIHVYIYINIYNCVCICTVLNYICSFMFTKNIL